MGGRERDGGARAKPGNQLLLLFIIIIKLYIGYI